MTQAQERRRFFRVTDEVGLKYLVADPVPLEGTKVDADGKLRADIVALEGQIRAGIEYLKSHGNPAAATLELMNRKINLLLADELPSTIEEKESMVCSVSLSACGIAFWTQEAIPLGSELKLEVTLLPSHLHLALGGVVIDCFDSSRAKAVAIAEDGRYLLRIDFKNMEDELQEVLIQHVLKCQSRDLRERREAREKKPAG
jgi:hypothetical protein